MISLKISVFALSSILFICTLSLVFSIITLAYTIFMHIKFAAWKESTHKVEFVPMDAAWASSDKKIEEINKESSQDYSDIDSDDLTDAELKLSDRI